VTDPREEISVAWRGPIDDDELRLLFEDAWGEPFDARTGMARLEAHSLGWATARDHDGVLVGFVNVAWDGGRHAFLLDTSVASHLQRQGVGTRLVTAAATRARDAGCHWLHVDYEPTHRSFYVDACGFDVTAAGLFDLQGTTQAQPQPESGGSEGIP
jgi:GNAT superfamily N-acetyltransferase